MACFLELDITENYLRWQKLRQRLLTDEEKTERNYFTV